MNTSDAKPIARVFSITVPSGLESMAVLEDLCDGFLASRQPFCSPDAELVLRLAVVEGCRNALLQKAQRGRLSVVTVTLLRAEDDPSNVGLEIMDPGRGLEINRHLPPYPDSCVGAEFLVTRVMDQAVLAKVTSPTTITLRCVHYTDMLKDLPRETILLGLKDGGYGLLSLCRTWETVVFEHLIGEGTLLRLQHPQLCLMD